MKKVVLCLLVAVAVTGFACAGTRYYACGHISESGPKVKNVTLKNDCPTCVKAKSGARQKAAQDFGNGSAPNAYGACSDYEGSTYNQCESSYLKTYSDHKSAAEGNYQ